MLKSLFKRASLKIRVYILILNAWFIFPFLTKRGSSESKIQYRLLVIPQLTRIGDLVCTTPVFRAIKEKYPESHVAVVVGEFANTAGIVKNNPFVDEIVVFKTDEFLNFFGIFRFFKRIQEGKYNLSLNLAASTMGTLISVFGNVPNRVKIVRSQRPYSEILTDWMNTVCIQYIEGEHIPTLYLKALGPLGISVPSHIRKEIFPGEGGSVRAKRFFEEFNIESNDLVIGISVTAGNEIKEWGTERFGELARCIIQQYDAKVIFIGAPRDQEKLEKANQYTGNIGIIATTFSIEELPSLLKKLTIFISSDSGPMHMAHALGVPLIDIIGPVDPSEQAPSDDVSIVVLPPSNIRPTIFALRRPGDPKESKKACQSITVKQVNDAFTALYARIQE